MPLSQRLLTRPAPPPGRPTTSTAELGSGTSSAEPGVTARRAAARPFTPIWVVLAVIGWAGVAILGLSLASATPPRAGFDLELLLRAGRHVAMGMSPYDASLLRGTALSSVDLFYSYPPPVAQYLSLFANVPSPVMLVAWALISITGLALVTVALARATSARPRQSRREQFRDVGLPVLAIAPFVLPFSIALLFGNVDALFPLLYGLMLLAVLVPTTLARFGGGVGLAIASVAKIHPASMGLWFLVRGLRERHRAASLAATAGLPPTQASGPTARMTSARGPAAFAPGGWVVILSAIAVGCVILAVSLAVYGIAPWTHYVSVVQSAASARIVDFLNIGPAAQLTLLIGGGEDVARLLQIVVLVLVMGGTAVAAWRCEDAVESFAWASVASLIVLPVTWIHYPVVLLPVAVAAWLRSSPARRRELAALFSVAGALAIIAVVLPVLVWISMALILVATRRSIPTRVVEAPFPTLEPSRVARFPTPGARA